MSNTNLTKKHGVNSGAPFFLFSMCIIFMDMHGFVHIILDVNWSDARPNDQKPWWRWTYGVVTPQGTTAKNET